MGFFIAVDILATGPITRNTGKPDAGKTKIGRSTPSPIEPTHESRIAASNSYSLMGIDRLAGSNVHEIAMEVGQQ